MKYHNLFSSKTVILIISLLAFSSYQALAQASENNFLKSHEQTESFDFEGLTISDGATGSVTYPVVHTGVKEFYDSDSRIDDPGAESVLYWQDAGRSYNEPFYTDNGNNTISDNVTGLMWQKYMGEKLTFTEARIKADTLSLGGYDDWRIPTIKELYSLIQFSGQVKGAGAITSFIDTIYFEQPLGDLSIGEREIDAQTWSSTHYTGLTMRADTTVFGVNFIDGRIKGYPKYNPRTGYPNSMYFRMVRGNLDYGSNSFQDNNDGTISDIATNLMWQQSDDGQGRDWLEAISYCEDLDLAGYTDWHLPNIKELQSIVDYSRSPMKTQSPAIDPIFDVSEILDPAGNPGHYPYFWSTTTHLDGINPYSGAAYIAFGKALGMMNGVLMDVHGAGAQRSDPKVVEDGQSYPAYLGPQGDLRVVYNYCRCVRNIESATRVIQKKKSEQVIVCPNPFKNELSISSEGVYTIEIRNLKGVTLLHEEMEENFRLLNLSHLSSGIYLLILSNNQGSVLKKIIKV